MLFLLPPAVVAETLNIDEGFGRRFGNFGGFSWLWCLHEMGNIRKRGRKKKTNHKQTKPRMESPTRTHILSSHTSKGKNDASYIPLLNKTLHHARTHLLLLFYCSFLHYSVHLSGQTAASKWQLHKHLWENLIGTNYLLVVWDLRSRSSYFSWETPGEGVASFQKNELSYSLNESS